MAVLGIDFGTTYTFVIKGYKRDDGQEGFSVVGEHLYESPEAGGKGDVLRFSNGIRTVIGYSDKLGWKIGQKALAHKDDLGEDGDRTFDIYFELKRALLNICKAMEPTGENVNNGRYISALGDLSVHDYKEEFGHTFIVKGKKTYYNAIELTKIFLNLLIFNDGECGPDDKPKECKNAIFNYITFDDVNCIVMGAPSDDMKIHNTSQRYSDNVLPEILEYLNGRLEVNLEEKNLLVIPEPQLAGEAFVADHLMPKLESGKGDEQEQLLIIDIGGGTSDFAVLEKISENENDEGKIIAPFPSQGNIDIAGKNFDAALEKCIKDKYAYLSGRFDDESIRHAKEELFLTKKSPKIKSWIDSKIEPLSPETKINDVANEIYKKYLESGRRTAIKDKWERRYYCVVYNDKHIHGVDFDGYDSEEYDFTDSAKYEDVYEDKCKELAEKLKAYVDKNRKKLNLKKLKVLFVGGSSQSRELRNTLLSKGLGLYQKGDKWYYMDESSNEYPIYDYCLETGRQKESSLTSSLTCANMIAIGAVRLAEDQLAKESTIYAYSVPSLWLGIPIFKNGKLTCKEYYPLISQDMKNGIFMNLKKYTVFGNGEVKAEDRTIRNLPWCLTYNIQEDKGGILFNILKEVISPQNTDGLIQFDKNEPWYIEFPRNNRYYKFTINEKKRHKVCVNEEYDAYFLADKPKGKPIAIFVCISKKCKEKNGKYYFDDNDSKPIQPERIVNRYDYNFPNPSNIENVQFDGNLQYFYGIKDYCKKYAFNEEENKFKGEPYSIYSKVDKDGYGWKVISLPNSDNRTKT